VFSVIDVVKKAEEALGVKISHKILNITKNEIPEQYLDWTKAKKVLGWEPKITFSQGLKNTFNWHKNEL
jgi:nucleoside-diphosphate-sugar epimerase